MRRRKKLEEEENETGGGEELKTGGGAKPTNVGKEANRFLAGVVLHVQETSGHDALVDVMFADAQ